MRDFADQYEIVRAADFYIFNYSAGVLRKYAKNGTQILPQSLSSAEVSYFNESFEKISEIRQAIEAAVVPETLAASLYELVGASYKVNDLSDYFYESKGLGETFDEATALAGMITGIRPAIVFNAKVNFTDGSYSYTDIAEGSSRRDFKLSFVATRDADNNTIPMDAAGYYTYGELRFTRQRQAGIDKFIDAAFRSGVSIAQPHHTGPIQSTYQMSCNEQDESVFCTVSPISTTAD
ncbi:hypothetical protein L2725_15855 [Shewanella corallii]|uniref:Uncharacterized protein n=1 Tax=Shewanella corallii TaxID=560080 RepID=A0ABT0NAR5_9GAMM|nr:hypothetical protein [Shewanella corallii]MCL2915235.1 hypothetical protein [Shewanella corallii]